MTISTTTQAHDLSIQGLLPEWLEALRDNECSPRTITRYSDQLKDFLRTVGAEATLAELTTKAVELHNRRMRVRGCVGETRCNAITAISSFSRWAMREGYIAADPTVLVIRPRRGDPQVRFLREEDIDTLVEVLTEPERLTPNQRFLWRRSRLAVLLMLHAGLRISEVANLRWSQIDLQARTLQIVRSKHKRNRTVVIDDTLHAELQQVPKAERIGPIIYCWKQDGTQKKRAPLEVKSLAHIFERWVTKRLEGFNEGRDGEDKLRISAHQLRRAYATRLWRASSDLDLVRRRLGHRHLDTTQRYLAGGPDTDV